MEEVKELAGEVAVLLWEVGQKVGEVRGQLLKVAAGSLEAWDVRQWVDELRDSQEDLEWAVMLLWIATMELEETVLAKNEGQQQPQPQKEVSHGGEKEGSDRWRADNSG